jgi:mono/diheme cytochrome c family protein
MIVGWWSIDNDCGIVDAATSMQPAHVSSARCGSSPPFVRTTVAALGLVVAALSVAHAESVDFSREIQPLLAKRCFSCHGPDTQEGGLRLDDAATATRELDNGTRAIVPGDEAASALLERITSTDPDLQMPPEGSRLTAAQVGAIRRWIAAGAEFREHWAFRPVVRPTPPTSDAAAKPIDAFIRDGLARRGLPVPSLADKRSLLRRVTYGVTGLPPAEQEMRDFLADDSPQAWEKVVDRLLASPHYGEQWARHWLDLVRYADTNSFERDGNKPHAWRYRDYVIRSLNDDKPYDRFVIEQLAGDELPAPGPDDLIATGYYRLGLWDDEPADRVQARYDWLDDIVATTGQTFLGLTINCARCHDHKIDPIPQKDYYSLLAFFHNVTPMANDGETIERKLFTNDEAQADYRRKLADLNRRRDVAQKAVTEIENRFRVARDRETDDVARADDLDDLQFRFFRDTWTSLPAFDELKPEDVGLVPGNRFDIAVAPSLRHDSFGYVFTGFLKVPADGDYTFVLDSDDGARLTIGGTVAVDYDGIHGTGEPRTVTVPLTAGRLPIRLDYFQWLHGKGLSVSWSGPGFDPRPLSAGKGYRKRAELVDAIRDHGERILGVAGKRDYDKKVAALKELKQESVPVEQALVVTESGTQAPDTFVFPRGNPHAEPTPERLIAPAFPAILRPQEPVIVPPASGVASTGRRTALATWIASPNNPLSARVLANRIWQHHFGRGIVRTASNFGLMGDPPTHPELLDWLASELVAGNWRLKPLHKTILMSEAYRAASAGTADALAKDPLNDALWRFDMRRLTAEELRDSIHVASGGFNPKMFGPGVYPDIPKAVMAGQSRPGSGWGSSPPEEQARRSIYIHVKRSLITPILADFDMADTDTSCPVRFTTTQPTQALGMMNGDFLQRQARLFAERVRREAGGPDDVATAAEVRRALEIALTRTPTDEEVTRGVALIDKLEGQDGVGPSRALELYCAMVLNLNEFAYLD